MIVYRNQYGSFVNSERIGREREREVKREKERIFVERRGDRQLGFCRNEMKNKKGDFDN